MKRPTSERTEDGLQGTAQRALVDAIRRRDRGAFTELYRLYHPKLFGYLRRLLPNVAMAEEVIDDVMFVVWTDARKYRGQSAVSSWIFGIAYNKAMTALRKEQRYRAILDRGADAEAMPANMERDFEVLTAGLARLSPDHRQVVVLTYFCGFSYDEISRIARCPVNTVKTRMFHARRRLKILLPELAGYTKEQSHEYR